MPPARTLRNAVRDMSIANDLDLAGGADERVALEDLLTYRVCILAKMLDRVSASELAKACALGVAEWRVLAQLAVHSPSTVRWLAARLRVDRAEVSRAAAALIARKFARREADPRDARSVLFSITEAGATLYQRIMPDRISLHERLMAELSAAESATLVTAVEKLTRFLDRDEKVLPAPMPRDAAAEPARAKRR